ncbi:MAG: tRNA lysidine(34) synthetase TilS, partial [Acidobacteriota bacterium]
MLASTAIADAVARAVREDGARSWLVAFSGGPDSTTLAWALESLRRSMGLRIRLAHIDHGLDAGSAARARRAPLAAARLDLPITTERLSAESRAPNVSLEAWARRERYAALHQIAARFDLERIATGHHADDQAETVLLRMAFGSGLRGLAGIRRRFGRISRPLLDVRRPQIEAALDELGLDATDDPTNRDLDRPRNLIRHHILPEWNSSGGHLVENLHRLADGADRAFRRLDAFFKQQLTIESLPAGGGQLHRRALESLPKELMPHALSTLEKIARKPLPSPATARRELNRQLRSGGRVGCDAGSGWRWQADGRSLRLLPPRKPLAEFTYTVQVPGSVSVAEIGASLRITDAPPERSDVAAPASTAFLRPPSSACRHVVIRNRRSGDRFLPPGRHREKRLKEVLIDLRIPRDERDRLPLVVIDDRIAWIPGVARDERFRPQAGEPTWLAELLTQPDG